MLAYANGKSGMTYYLSSLFQGNIQSAIVMEEIIDQIATFLGDKTPEQIKEINLYKTGQVTAA